MKVGWTDGPQQTQQLKKANGRRFVPFLKLPPPSNGLTKRKRAGEQAHIQKGRDAQTAQNKIRGYSFAPRFEIQTFQMPSRTKRADGYPPLGPFLPASPKNFFGIAEFRICGFPCGTSYVKRNDELLALRCDHFFNGVDSVDCDSKKGMKNKCANTMVTFSTRVSQCATPAFVCATTTQ